MKTIHKFLILSSLLCNGVWAGPGTHGPSDWAALRGKCLRVGAVGERVDQILGICRQRGLSVEDSDRLMAPVYAAKKETLPVGCVYAKIEEGLVKRAAVSNIISTAEARLGYMREAKKLVSSMLSGIAAGHGDGLTRLIENTGMALESGLEPAIIKTVFRRNGRRRLGRLAHAMEAAETLHLEGFEDSQIQRVLIDFLDRNLSRHEMFRAVEVLKNGLAAGKDFDSIYTGLWVEKK